MVIKTKQKDSTMVIKEKKKRIAQWLKKKKKQTNKQKDSTMVRNHFPFFVPLETKLIFFFFNFNNKEKPSVSYSLIQQPYLYLGNKRKKKPRV